MIPTYYIVGRVVHNGETTRLLVSSRDSFQHGHKSHDRQIVPVVYSTPVIPTASVLSRANGRESIPVEDVEVVEE
jgi:hypothetical protein